MSTTPSKKSKLHEFLLKEGVGGVPVSKDLGSYFSNPPKAPKRVEKVKTQTENQVRSACNKWLKDNNWIQKTIYTGGIPTGHGGYAINPAKGIPDAICFHRATKRMIWIEYKNSAGGTLSIDQKDWHYLLRLCGCEVFVITSLKELKEVLNEAK